MTPETEEIYGKAWAEMAKKEGRAPKLPPSIKTAQESGRCTSPKKQAALLRRRKIVQLLYDNGNTRATLIHRQIPTVSLQTIITDMKEMGLKPRDSEPGQ